MNYLFIGNGRIARHMSHYLSEHGHRIAVWSRRSTVDLDSLIKKSDIICISTRDHEIQNVIRAYRLDELNKALVHFSGSQYIEGAHGLHPLMSFGNELYSKNVYQSMHFVGTSTETDFKSIFPKLKNTYHKIEPQKLALYHAYCSMAGNFPQILWSELSEKFENEVLVTPEALKPYLKQITENFIRQGPSATTGPLVRNDNRTVVRHLDALSGKSLQGIYFSFVNLFQKKQRMETPHESRGISTDQI